LTVCVISVLFTRLMSCRIDGTSELHVPYRRLLRRDLIIMNRIKPTSFAIHLTVASGGHRRYDTDDDPVTSS